MDSPFSLPGAPPDVQSRIKETLSWSLIGFTFTVGITVLQTYMYFRNRVTDSTAMKLFVSVLFILDTAGMVLTMIGVYGTFVTDFGDVLLLLKIPGTLAFENITAALIAALTQGFFANRLWALSKRNGMLVGGIVILALGSLGPGIAVSVHLYTAGNVFSLKSSELRITGGLANGLSAVRDILITVALCYYLHSKRTNFKRTDFMIDQLILYSVNRGGITAACQVCSVITFVAFPERSIFVPFMLLSGKLYCNTLLATLNAQRSIREDSNNIIELGTRILNHLETPTSGSGNTRSSASRLDLQGASSRFVINISAKTADTSNTSSADNDV